MKHIGRNDERSSGGFPSQKSLAGGRELGEARARRHYRPSVALPTSGSLLTVASASTWSSAGGSVVRNHPSMETDALGVRFVVLPGLCC